MFDQALVDPQMFTMLQILGAQRKDEFVENRQPGERPAQKTNKEGVPMWKLTLSAVNTRGRGDTLNVSVPFDVYPMEKFNAGESVTLPGLVFGVMRRKEGGYMPYWTAAGIESASAQK